MSDPAAFEARVYKVGINRCVDVPARITATLGGETHVPILVRVRGHTARTTLMPAGGGRHRAFLTGRLRRAAGIEAGDRIAVEVSRDPQGWATPVPAELVEALEPNELASAAFSNLTPAKRREFVRFIASAKRPETRARRIERSLEMLEDLAFDADDASG